MVRPFRGPSIPHILTGRMSMHPRAAIECREGPAPDDYVAFHDQTMTRF